MRVVAGKFILTAVQRKNLGQAWTLVGPGIRQGLTYKEWLTGNIPVVPFLKPIKLAPMKVDLSSEELRAARGVPRAEVKGEGRDLRHRADQGRQGDKAHWVVNSWVPRAHPTIPNNPSQLDG